MPASTVKLIKTQMAPLAEESLPKCKDLRPFWDKVRRTLRSLDPSFTEHNLRTQLGATAIENLGPLFVGSAGWQQLSGKPFNNWDELEAAVEENFGMTQQQLMDQFFSMEPEEGERPSAFALGVEVLRRKLNACPVSTYHAFTLRFLGDTIREQLDQVRWAKKASGNYNWGWEDVISMCKDMESGCVLSKKKSPEEKPAYPPANRGSSGGTGSAGGGAPAKGSKLCEICDRLGGFGAQTHTKEWCYCNPNSKMYKPGLHETRVSMAKQKGIKVPPELDFKPKDGGQNFVSEIKELLGSTAYAQAETQELVEHLIAYQ